MSQKRRGRYAPGWDEKAKTLMSLEGLDRQQLKESLSEQRREAKFHQAHPLKEYHRRAKFLMLEPEDVQRQNLSQNKAVFVREDGKKVEVEATKDGMHILSVLAVGEDHYTIRFSPQDNSLMLFNLTQDNRFAHKGIVWANPQDMAHMYLGQELRGRQLPLFLVKTARDHALASSQSIQAKTRKSAFLNLLLRAGYEITDPGSYQPGELTQQMKDNKGKDLDTQYLPDDLRHKIGLKIERRQATKSKPANYKPENDLSRNYRLIGLDQNHQRVSQYHRIPEEMLRKN